VYLVSLINELMCSGDEFETVNMIELSCNLVTEEPTSTARRNRPSFNIFRITPDQIAECAFMRNLLGTGNDTDLINCTDLGAQTAMNAKNLTIDNGSEHKKIKYLAARLPNRGVTVLLLALLVESIDLGDLTGLVIASDEGDLVGVSWTRQRRYYLEKGILTKPSSTSTR
jgi:hypothetical protein